MAGSPVDVTFMRLLKSDAVAVQPLTREFLGCKLKPKVRKLFGRTEGRIPGSIAGETVGLSCMRKICERWQTA